MLNMLPQPLVLSTLAFFAISYPLISFIFSPLLSNSHSQTKKSKLWLAFGAIALLYAVKLGYEVQHVHANYYQLLETPRSSSVLEIRQAYKKVSKIYHPDKNSAIDSDERFQAIKKAYDALMDESQREIYNRFGEEHLDFDPRQDEMKLLTETVIIFLGWSVLAYTYTSPPGARSCRTWVAIGGLILLALQITFILTESSLPANTGVLPQYLTEYEFILLCHSMFAMMIAALRCVGEAYYVDTEKTSILVLQNVMESQKKLDILLHQVQTAMTHQESNAEDEILAQLQDLQSFIESSSRDASKMVDELKNSTSSIGANYYWVVFVLMYGGIYLLQ